MDWYKDAVKQNAENLKTAFDQGSHPPVGKYPISPPLPPQGQHLTETQLIQNRKIEP